MERRSEFVLLSSSSSSSSSCNMGNMAMKKTGKLSENEVFFAISSSSAAAVGAAGTTAWVLAVADVALGATGVRCFCSDSNNNGVNIVDISSVSCYHRNRNRNRNRNRGDDEGEEGVRGEGGGGEPFLVAVGRDGLVSVVDSKSMKCLNQVYLSLAVNAIDSLFISTSTSTSTSTSSSSNNGNNGNDSLVLLTSSGCVSIWSLFQNNNNNNNTTTNINWSLLRRYNVDGIAHACSMATVAASKPSFDNERYIIVATSLGDLFLINPHIAQSNSNPSLFYQHQQQQQQQHQQQLDHDHPFLIVKPAIDNDVDENINVSVGNDDDDDDEEDDDDDKSYFLLSDITSSSNPIIALMSYEGDVIAFEFIDSKLKPILSVKFPYPLLTISAMKILKDANNNNNSNNYNNGTDELIVTAVSGHTYIIDLINKQVRSYFQFPGILSSFLATNLIVEKSSESLPSFVYVSSSFSSPQAAHSNNSIRCYIYPNVSLPFIKSKTLIDYLPEFKGTDKNIIVQDLLYNNKHY